ncbi:hypothetical protein QQ045_031951 [Rhodiola kirilowii]
MPHRVQRKQLGDISNARKATLPSENEKTKAKNANVLELGDPGIGENGYLHNHAQCIESQRKAVDMSYSFETINLCKVMTVDKIEHVACSSCNDTSLNMSFCLNSSYEEVMELHHKELSELVYNTCSPVHGKAKLPTKFKCSPPCKIPKSPCLDMQWDNGDVMECGLTETPTLSFLYKMCRF